jgi:hypothetical protein
MLHRDLIKKIVLSCRDCPVKNNCSMFGKGQKDIPEECSLQNLFITEYRYIREGNNHCNLLQMG